MTLRNPIDRYVVPSGGLLRLGNTPGAVAPVPEFVGSPVSGVAPLNVAFTNQTTGDYLSLQWDFGDGQTSSSANPTHEYADEGAYSVVLSVTWSGGVVTRTRTSYVAVSAAPAPAITLAPASPASGTVGVQSGDMTVAWADLPTAITITPAVAPGPGTLSPASISAGPGSGSAALRLTPLAAAAHLVSLANDGGIANPPAVGYSASAAPAAPPTTATLSGSNSATSGAPHLSTIALDQPADQTYTIAWARSDGGTGPATSTIAAGQTSVSAASAWAAAGSGRTVDFTISPSLTRAGRPLSVNVSEAGALPALTLIAAGAGTYPWTAGHAFKPGDIPSGAPLGGGVQITVKSQWPDGSAKIAVLAGVSTFTGATKAIAIGVGQPPTGAWLTLAQLVATGITASISTDAYGSATWTSADFSAPFSIKAGLPAEEQWWAAGPLMSSWIYRKQIGSDPHLTAWLEVRLYSSGDVEVLPWIENGYLMMSGPTGKPGIYTFTLGGSVRFGPTSLPVYHHTRQPLISGSTLSYWLGSDKTVALQHDAAYLSETGLTNRWMSSLSRQQFPFDGSGQNHRCSAQFTPYELHTVGGAGQNTWQPIAMGSGGESASIGTQPVWDGIYLVGTNTDGLPYRQLMQECFRFGAYQIHYRDENTNRPIRFSQHTDTGLRQESPKTNIDTVRGNTTTVTPTISGYITDVEEAKSFKWSPSHQPASPLLAYIVSGRFWMMEECQHISGVNYLLAGTTASTTGGVFDTHNRNNNNTRETAWCLRNLFFADCATPDDDPLKPDMTAAVGANIDNYWAKYIDPALSPTPNPFGIVRSNDPAYGDASQAWQHDFFVGVMGKLVAFRAGGSFEKRKRAREFFDWTAKSVVGRAGGTGASEWLYRYATTEFPAAETSSAAVQPTVTTDIAEWASGTWMASWGTMYDRKAAEYAGSWPRVDGDLAGNYPTDPLSHWGRYFEALMICTSLGATGAAAGLARLRTTATRQQWDLGQSGSVFSWQLPTSTGIDSVALPLEDFSSYVPAVGMRSNINANSSTSVDYDVVCALAQPARWWNGYNLENSFGSMGYSYSGSTWASTYGAKGAIVMHGGGHGGQIGAFAYLFDMDSRTWKQVGALRNLPPNLQWAGYANYQAGASYDYTIDQRDTSWMDYSWNNSKIKFSDHEYLQNAYISQAQGGGRLGSLYLPQATVAQDPGVADPRTGRAYRWAPHLFDLETGRMTRATAAVVTNIATGDDSWQAYGSSVAVVDTTRNRLWYLHQGWPYGRYHDLTGSLPLAAPTMHHPQKTSGGNIAGHQITNGVALYVAEADAIVVFYPAINGGYPSTAGMPIGAKIYGMSSGFPVDVERDGAVGTRAMGRGGLFVGAAWCPTLSKFYMYEGHGDTFCTVLTPSSLDFATCTWTWSKEEFGGVAPANKVPGAQVIGNAQAESPQGKFVWVPAYGCFAWHDGPTTSGVCADGVTRSGIVQLWRPPGTPA